MRHLLPVMLLVMSFLSCADLSAQEFSDVKVLKVEIVPNSVKDLEDPFFRGRPMLEIKPTSAENNERVKLPPYRSYRFIVTVSAKEGKTPANFLLITQSVRDGKTETLGKTHIALDGRRTKYACYNVFPAEGGPGDCVIRTIVEGEDESNAHEFKASVAR